MALTLRIRSVQAPAQPDESPRVGACAERSRSIEAFLIILARLRIIIIHFMSFGHFGIQINYFYNSSFYLSSIQSCLQISFFCINAIKMLLNSFLCGSFCIWIQFMGLFNDIISSPGVQ
jgi:hypothetical protein